MADSVDNGFAGLRTPSGGIDTTQPAWKPWGFYVVGTGWQDQPPGQPNWYERPPEPEPEE